jgi:hypothetical protein
MNDTAGESPQASPPPPSGAPVIQSQGGTPKPVYKKPWFIAMIAGFLIIFVVVGLSGGGDTTSSESASEPEVVLTPSVTGLRLDIAYSDFDAVGVGEGDIEIVGGGTFGILDESNWTVCEQSPPAEAPLEAPFRFIIDRKCPDSAGSAAESDASTETDATATEDSAAAETIAEPDSPIIFTASVSGNIADMRKDLRDLEIAIAEDGVLRILGNITEINFNYAQLASRVAPESIAEAWNAEMLSLESSVTTLTDRVSSDGTTKQVKAAVKEIRANLDSLETIVNSLE